MMRNTFWDDRGAEAWEYNAGMHTVLSWLRRHRFWVGVLGVGLIATAFSLTLIYFETAPSEQISSPPTPIPSSTSTPTPSPTPTIDPIQQQIQSMSTEEKVGALLMLHTAGTNAANLDQFVQHYHLGGIILMGDNISGSVANLANLTASLKQTNPDYPPLIAIDEEGCTVKRLPWDTFPCPPQLGTQAVSATQAAFAQRGQLLQQAGITVDFGVVADVTANANSFIYPRVFGGDPRQVADRVAAAVRGLQPFTVATLKHFPGHGETEDNSHTVVPVTTVSKATWEQQDKPPFAAGIAAGSQMVMVGQLAYSAIDTQPATLSATWHRILRQELGFNGVVVTDAMGMLQNSGEAQYQDPVQNAIAAINAGNDLILFVSNYDIQANPGNKVNLDHLISGLVSAVNSGQLPEAVIDQALTRTLKLRAEVGGR